MARFAHLEGAALPHRRNIDRETDTLAGLLPGADELRVIADHVKGEVIREELFAFADQWEQMAKDAAKLASLSSPHYERGRGRHPAV